jgi:hypothetical protein
MDENTPPQRPLVRHPLFLSWGGLSLRLGDQGITPEADGLRFTRDGRQVFRPYSDLVGVNLSMSALPRGPTTAQTTLRFSNGMVFSVVNTDAWGRADDDQNQHYYRFKADLHQRLIDAGAIPHIRFTTGATPGRSRFMQFAVFLAIAFFVGGPIAVIFMTGKAEAFVVLLAGAAFVLPVYRTMQRNQPGMYDPRYPPDMLR